jgi:hypothetical protein
VARKHQVAGNCRLGSQASSGIVVSSEFTAVILSGDRSKDDPLLRHAGVPSKALIPVAGKPMVLRVIEALGHSRSVGDRLLSGPPPQALEQNDQLSRGIADGEYLWLPNEASPSTSACAAMSTVPEDVPVLVTTADHALLTAEAVDFFCARSMNGAFDLTVALARYRKVAAEIPGVTRTQLKFGDDIYCSCNLFAFLTPQGRRAADFWRTVEQQRKNPLRVLGMIGWYPALRYLFNLLTLQQALDHLSARLNLRVGAVILPFAEAALDVDDLDDLSLVETIAQRRRV